MSLTRSTRKSDFRIDAIEEHSRSLSDQKYSGLAHSAAPEEMDDVEKFLQEKLPPKGDKAAEEGKSEL